jgi:hypothetical protein
MVEVRRLIATKIPLEIEADAFLEPEAPGNH